jgi:hypothetical protein
MDMDRFTLVLLRRPANAAELPAAEVDALRKQPPAF